MSISDLTFADPEVVADPETYHASLREHPLHFDPGLGVYICSNYAQMRRILRDTDRFSNLGSQTMDSMRPPPDEVLEIQASGYPRINTLVTNDPPAHTRYRRLVDDPFRPRSIEKLRGAILEIVEDVIDGFAARGEAEIVSAFAIPIPITVIADMLGLSRALAGQIKIWSDAAVEPLGMMVSDERLIACARSVQEFQHFIADEIDVRRKAPRDDLLSAMVQARDEQGGSLDTAEIISLTQQFLVAGNETTTNALAAGVRLLCDDPQLQDSLRAQPDRMMTFANEVLRLSSPVQGLFRVVRADTELDGVQLPAGARIMLRFAAANRDADKYANAEEVDLQRSNAGTHVAFGAGIHHCIGANLAREEMIQAFTMLLAKTRNLRASADNDFAHHPSVILRGLKSLQVEFDPVSQR